MATVAAVALVGSSSAFAQTTAVCSSDEGGSLTCASHLMTTIHSISKGKAKASTEIFTVECNLLTSGTILALASPQVTHLTSTHTNCTNGCTVTEVSGGTLMNMLKTAANQGEVTYGGGEISVNCLFFKCVYSTAGVKGTVVGANGTSNGIITMTKQALKKVSGSGCPETAFFDVELESLTGWYIKN